MNNYWANRFIEEEKRVNDLATDEIRRQQLQYEKSLAKINRDIEVWYGRIAKNNEVSLAEVKQLLNAKELKEFKWTLEEYIKYGKENGISGDWSKQLENASARVHIERLEALKLQVRGQIEKLYNGRESGFESYLKNIYEDQYNHTAFQIAKGTGVGTNLYKLNDKLVGEVIKKPWAPDGKNFSERIWGDKNRLINTLHTELTQGFIRGDSIKEMTDNISKKMNVSKSNVERLVRTESAAYASKAKKQSFIDLEVEKFEVVATLDTRTSEICQDMDGKVFDMKDYEVGVTAPPYHINCRSTTAPYFEDEEDDTRAARNPKTEKTEYVPANMKYKEWEERYLKKKNNTDNQGIINITTFNPLIKKEIEKEFGKLNSSDVILREERLEHIKERHPEIVEVVKEVFEMALEDPTIILSDYKNKNTILLINDIEEKNIVFAIKLSLVNVDNKNIENSIITAYKIRKREVKRLQKKNKVLFDKNKK